MENNIKINLQPQDIVENQAVEYGNSDEEFLNEPAITTSVQKAMCGNITPPIM